MFSDVQKIEEKLNDFVFATKASSSSMAASFSFFLSSFVYVYVD